MNNFEKCFHAWHGSPAKLNQKTHCDHGYMRYSDTGLLVSGELCPDWSTRCSRLKHHKSKSPVGWLWPRVCH
jgi:hypothetical protein